MLVYCHILMHRPTIGTIAYSWNTLRTSQRSAKRSGRLDICMVPMLVAVLQLNCRMPFSDSLCVLEQTALNSAVVVRVRVPEQSPQWRLGCAGKLCFSIRSSESPPMSRSITPTTTIPTLQRISDFRVFKLSSQTFFRIHQRLSITHLHYGRNYLPPNRRNSRSACGCNSSPRYLQLRPRST